MVTVRMSEAEARKAGLTKAKKRTTRNAAPRDKAETRCCTCGEVFTGDTAETNHVERVGHYRYEMVI